MRYFLRNFSFSSYVYLYLGMPLGLCTVDGHPFKSFHCIDKPPTSDRYISIFTTIQYRVIPIYIYTPYLIQIHV